MVLYFFEGIQCSYNLVRKYNWPECAMDEKPWKRIILLKLREVCKVKLLMIKCRVLLNFVAKNVIKKST